MWERTWKVSFQDHGSQSANLACKAASVAGPNMRRQRLWETNIYETTLMREKEKGGRQKTKKQKTKEKKNKRWRRWVKSQRKVGGGGGGNGRCSAIGWRWGGKGWALCSMGNGRKRRERLQRVPESENSKQNLSTRRLDRVHRRRIVRNRLPSLSAQATFSCRSP